MKPNGVNDITVETDTLSSIRRGDVDCLFVLNTHSIRRSVTRPVLVSLVVSLVLSRLDYGNAALAGLPCQLTDRLQAVLNSAARLIYGARRSDHVTPLLRDLHWLRVPERIKFKLAVLVYRCLHGLAPSYLTDELNLVAEVVTRPELRSSSTTDLLVPRTNRSTIGDRAFPVAAARVWNELSSAVRLSPSVAVFASGSRLNCSAARME